MIRLSPSTMVLSARGIRSVCVTAVAATASEGETIAPRMNATGQGIPIQICAATATTPAVKTTSATASTMIALVYVRNSRQSVCSAA